MERRFSSTTVGLETRDNGKPLIVGYAAVFHRDGDAGTEYQLFPGLVERIAPTAFTRSVVEDQDDIRALINHDDGCILGRTSAGTCKVTVDARGLRYEIDPPDTQYARDVMVSIARGDISGSSFGFNARKDSIQPGEDYDIRLLEDVKLFDVGPVVSPAYTAASTGIRSAADTEDVYAKWQKWQAVQARLKEL